MTTQATPEQLNWLQTKAREWAQKVVDLHNTQVPAQYEPQKRALLATAKTIKETVEKITGPLDVLMPINQLGVVPIIIGVVAVAGAVAAIAKWTSDYFTFKEKVASYNALRQSGLDHGQALNVTQSTTGSGIFDSLKTPIKYAGLGFLGYVLARRMGWI